MTANAGAARGEISPLHGAQIPELYRRHLTRDFARAELKPLTAIKHLHKRGRYSCMVLQNGEEWLAYACFLHGGPGAVLLDYFAVEPPLRGEKLGSGFLGGLHSRMLEEGTVDGIIIECEAPEKAHGHEQRQICEKRIAFYTRAGAQPSGCGWRAFGVHYNLLWLPVRKPLFGSGIDIAGEISRIYRLAGFKLFITANTKAYNIV